MKMVLVLLMMVGLVACGGDDDPAASGSVSAEQAAAKQECMRVCEYAEACAGVQSSGCNRECLILVEEGAAGGVEEARMRLHAYRLAWARCADCIEPIACSEAYGGGTALADGACAGSCSG